MPYNQPPTREELADPREHVKRFERNPQILGYTPGSYTTLGENIQPPGKGPYYGSPVLAPVPGGRYRTPYSQKLETHGKFMSDEEWEAAKEEAARAIGEENRPIKNTRGAASRWKHGQRGHVQDIVKLVDEWRALNPDRPKVAAIPDQRRYWEDFIRRQTEEDRRIRESGAPYPEPLRPDPSDMQR